MDINPIPPTIPVEINHRPAAGVPPSEKPMLPTEIPVEAPEHIGVNIDIEA
jgi:hypothetical protein